MKVAQISYHGLGGVAFVFVLLFIATSKGPLRCMLPNVPDFPKRPDLPNKQLTEYVAPPAADTPSLKTPEGPSKQVWRAPLSIR